MKILENFHTHIYLCKHATGNIEDYAKKAIFLGYKTLGISDHGPLNEFHLKQFNTRRMSMLEYQNTYLKELEDNKKKFENKLTILGAVEIEYYQDMKNIYQQMTKELDYLILGQHKIVLPNGTIKKIYNCDCKEDLEAYTNNVIDGLNSGFFSILAHPDIFMMFYKKWDNSAILSSKRIIEAAIQNNVVLEINANGIRKEKIQIEENKYSWPYPRTEFWSLLKDYPEAKVIVSDDAHKVENLCDQATVEAYQFAKKLNIQLYTKLSESLKIKK